MTSLSSRGASEHRFEAVGKWIFALQTSSSSQTKTSERRKRQRSVSNSKSKCTLPGKVPEAHEACHDGDHEAPLSVGLSPNITVSDREHEPPPASSSPQPLLLAAAVSSGDTSLQVTSLTQESPTEPAVSPSRLITSVKPTRSPSMTREPLLEPLCSRGAHKVVLQDAMPFFPDLLQGKLSSTIVVDVELVGSVSLMRHPRQFKSLVDGLVGPSKVGRQYEYRNVPIAEPHRREVETDPEQLLRSLNVFLYPANPDGAHTASFLPLRVLLLSERRGPTLPLLAQLLKAPLLTKVLLHSRLLYRLLLLYLGTDRVEIEQVIDLQLHASVLSGIVLMGRSEGEAELEGVEVAEEAVRDVLTPSSSEESMMGDRRTGRGGEGRRCAATLSLPEAVSMGVAGMSALLTEGTQAFLNSKVLDIRDRVALQHATGKMDFEPLVQMSPLSSSSHGNQNNNGRGSTSLEDSEEQFTPDEVQQVHFMESLTEAEENRSSVPEEAMSTEHVENSNSMDILDHIVPAVGISVAELLEVHEELEAERTVHRKKAMQWQKKGLTSGEMVPTTPMAVAIHGATFHETFRALGTAAAFYTECLVPLHHRFSTTPDSIASLPQVSALRSYTAFLCEVMQAHGVHVSRTCFETIQSSVLAQISALVSFGQEWIDYETERQGYPALGEGWLEKFGAFELLDVSGVLQWLEKCFARAELDISTMPEEEIAATPAEITIEEEEDVLPATQPHMERSSSRKETSLSFAALILQNLRAEVQKALAKSLKSDLLRLVTRMEEEVHQLVSASGCTERSPAVVACRASLQLANTWLTLQERIHFQTRFTGQLEGVVRVQLSAAVPLKDSTDGVSAAVSSPLNLLYSIHPQWRVHTWSTGRIYASQPNLQNVDSRPMKVNHPLPPEVLAQLAPDGGTGAVEPSSPSSTLLLVLPTEPSLTLRHLYVPPPGCCFVSMDYNQVEMRLLAHFSEDPVLQAALTDHEDVLLGLARHLLAPSTSGGVALTKGADPTESVKVSDAQRAAVKIVFYGLIYGMGVQKMEGAVQKVLQTETAQAIPTRPSGELEQTSGSASRGTAITAQQFIDRVSTCYPGMMTYLQRTRAEARLHKRVRVLSGTRNLELEKNPFVRQQRAVALAIQGSAADVLQAAMRAVHRQRHSCMPYLPVAPYVLSMAVHDELIFTMPSGSVNSLAPMLRRTMESQADALKLRVPLKVKVKVGDSLGTLREWQSV